MSEWFELAFGPLYDVVYPHRDDEEADQAIASLSPWLEGVVLDVACGAGRYLHALHASGFDAVGIDLSPWLLAKARERGLGESVAQADMRRLPIRPGSTGSAISMFTSFGYFSTHDEQLLVLNEVARSLRVGGHFVLDFINGASLDTDSFAPTARKRAGFTIHESKSYDPRLKHLCKQVRVEDKTGSVVSNYTERLTLYGKDELGELLARAGLRVTGVFGDYQLSAYADHSPRLIHVCKKAD